MVFFDRLIAAVLIGGPRDIEPVVVYSRIEVVVLSPPSPKLVCESVDLLELLRSDPADPPEELLVFEVVQVDVQLGRKVPGHPRTPVVRSVVFGDVIHVMENEAVVLVALHRLRVPRVEEHCSVKRVIPSLLDNVDREIETLLHHYRQQMT